MEKIYSKSAVLDTRESQLARNLFMLLIIICCAATPVSAQQSVSIWPERDASISDTVNGHSLRGNGAGAQIRIGRSVPAVGRNVNRALLMFDISSVVPEGASIDSVTLTLYTLSTQSGPSPDVSIHKAVAGWGEGAGTGAGPQGEDATWLHRTFQPTEQWQNDGGDFDSAIISTLDEVSDQPGFNTWESTDGFVSMVQGWLDNPNENFGIIMRARENFSSLGVYASKEAAEEERRPVLKVFYTVVQVSNEDDEEIPVSAILDQNYPNPFNPTTNIKYTLPTAGRVRLSVYNILGQQMAILVDGSRNAGAHEVVFDASALSNGVYIYILEGTGFRLSRKLTLIK